MYLLPGSMLIALLFVVLGLVTDVCQSTIIIECEPNAIEFISGDPNIDNSNGSVGLTIYFNDSYIIAGFIMNDACKYKDNDNEANITFYDNNETFSLVEYRYIELRQDNFKMVLFEEQVVADKAQVYCHGINSDNYERFKETLNETKLNFFGCTYTNTSLGDNEVEEAKSISPSYTEFSSLVQSSYYSPASPVCPSPAVTALCPSPTITIDDIPCLSSTVTSADIVEASSFLSDSKAFFGIIIPVIVMFVVNLVAFFALLTTFIWRNRKNKTSKHNQTRTLREVPNESLYAMSSMEEDKIDSKSNGNNEDIYTPVLSTPRVLGMVEQSLMIQGEESHVNEDLRISHTLPRPVIEVASPYTLPVSTKKRSLQLVMNPVDNREYCEVAPRARSNSWTEQDLKNRLRKMNEKDQSNLDIGQGTADMVKAYLQQTL